MIYKLIELMIDELVKIRQFDGVSKNFQRDMQDAINALRKIKKYF